MINCFGSELKRFFHSYRIYLSLALGLSLMLHAFFEAHQSWSEYSPMMLLSIPLGLSDFTPFAAVFCVLPFADSFCEDYSSGIMHGTISRIGIKKYTIIRGLSVAASGAFVMTIIMLITIVLCILCAGLPETAESSAFLMDSVWGRAGLLLKYKGLLVFLLRILLAGLFGALWALVGLATSVIIPNRYIVLTTPFIIYQIMWFLLEGTPINPVFLLRADYSGMPSLQFVFFYQIISILVLLVFSINGIRKKVQA